MLVDASGLANTAYGDAGYVEIKKHLRRKNLTAVKISNRSALL